MLIWVGDWGGQMRGAFVGLRERWFDRFDFDGDIRLGL